MKKRKIRSMKQEGKSKVARQKVYKARRMNFWANHRHVISCQIWFQPDGRRASNPPYHQSQFSARVPGISCTIDTRRFEFVSFWKNYESCEPAVIRSIRRQRSTPFSRRLYVNFHRSIRGKKFISFWSPASIPRRSSCLNEWTIKRHTRVR